MNSWATCKGALFSASSLCFRHGNGWDTMELKWFRRTRTSRARYFHCEKGVQNRVRLLLLDKRGWQGADLLLAPNKEKTKQYTKPQAKYTKQLFQDADVRKWRAVIPEIWETNEMSSQSQIIGLRVPGHGVGKVDLRWRPAIFPDWGESKKRKTGQGGSSM